ncbi:MAG: hypothetical protein SGBAC_012531 [Bacillariaceae sp.]
MGSSLPPSPSSSISTATSSGTSQHRYRLRKALIPLLCFLIAVNINFHGIYLEFATATGGSLMGNNAVGAGAGAGAVGSGSSNPIWEATREWKNLMAKHEGEQTTTMTTTTTPPSASATLPVYTVDDQAKEDLFNVPYGGAQWNLENSPMMDPFFGQEAEEDDEDEDYNEEYDEWRYIYGARGECFRNNTTVVNYYRPPNITTIATTTTTNTTTTTTKPKNNQTNLRRRVVVNGNGNGNANNSTSTTDGSIIPRRLIFTYHTNLFDCIFPRHLYDNVQHTIQRYADLWGIENKSNVDVLFFDDDDCAQVIAVSEPRLLPIFWAETNGAYRADICRIAALYQYGGYYLDVDIEVIQTLDPSPDVDFITAQAGNRVFFQAIMASTAGHPLLEHTLETMLVDWYMIPKIMQDHGKTTYEPDWFRGQYYADLRLEHVLQYGFDPGHSIGILMGPATLRIAYDRSLHLTKSWLLEEIENRQSKVYPALVRNTSHWGCNFMVHDNVTKTPYFYSRCRGTALCPSFDVKE